MAVTVALTRRPSTPASPLSSCQQRLCHCVRQGDALGRDITCFFLTIAVLAEMFTESIENLCIVCEPRRITLGEVFYSIEVLLYKCKTRMQRLAKTVGI